MPRTFLGDVLRTVFYNDSFEAETLKPNTVVVQKFESISCSPPMLHRLLRTPYYRLLLRETRYLLADIGAMHHRVQDIIEAEE
jgi:hypothetical protein